jgi:hypothetical protein
VKETGYAASRKRGIAGGLHPVYRAVISKPDSAAIAEVESIGLARWIVEVLNEAESRGPPSREEQDASYPKYQVFDDQLGYTVVARVQQVDAPPILRTRNAGFGQQVADLLNRVDPAQRIPFRRTPWWF